MYSEHHPLKADENSQYDYCQINTCANSLAQCDRPMQQGTKQASPLRNNALVPLNLHRQAAMLFTLASPSQHLAHTQRHA